jgi:hypothetical protein
LPTQEEILAAQAREAAGAAQAAAANAAYRNNTNPVLPVMGSSGYTQAEQQDAINEAAKHERLFHPAEYYGTTMANLQGMTLSQIASRYGTDTADFVQDYSRENPSARFREITSQYEATKGMTSTGGGEGTINIWCRLSYRTNRNRPNPGSFIRCIRTWRSFWKYGNVWWENLLRSIR